VNENKNINLILDKKQVIFLYELLLNLEASVRYGEADKNDMFYLVFEKYKENILKISEGLRVAILKQESENSRHEEIGEIVLNKENLRIGIRFVSEIQEVINSKNLREKQIDICDKIRELIMEALELD
jgi:hypothetical protein